MLKIATRDSDLALWQAHHVQALLKERAGVDAELLPLKTQGDLDQSTPLAILEGKGFFTKELEAALLAGQAHLAVHSLKDLPTRLPPGLKVGAVFSRADRREALLIRKESRADRQPLPVIEGGVLGTSSARRLAQVRVMAPDLKIKDVRGNVPTRVRKLREGQYDAILLAWAGLSRLELDLSDLDVVLLAPDEFLPAPGQAALAIEIRADDEQTAAIVETLNEPDVRRAIDAERGLLHLFAGGCKLPLGTASQIGDTVKLAAVYGAQRRTGEWVAFRCEKEAVDPVVVAEAAFTDLLAQKLAWAEREKPLNDMTVAVTRPAAAADALREAVERMGGRLLPVPTLAFEPAGDRGQLAAAHERLADYDWLLFTSANAVHYFFELDRRHVSLPEGVRVSAVGKATARALRELNIQVALTGPGGTGGDLAEELLKEAGPGARMLWPTAESRREEMPERLEAAGVQVEPLVIYRSTLPPAEARVAPDQVNPQWVLVTSPAAGRNFIELYGAPEGARWAAIGPTTQAEMQKLLKIPVTVAREASLEALAEVLV